MSTLTADTYAARAQTVTAIDHSLIVDLEDGRTITVPIGWYPRILYGTEKERKNWRLIGKGVGIHWPDLDEDISVDNLLSDRRSGESPRSFKKWLEDRSKSDK
jgi:hypothetical protein